MVIVLCGLTGTGKSTVAKLLARKLRADVLSSDEIRKAFAGLSPYESAKAAFGEGIYSKEMTDRVYRYMIERAVELGKRGKVIIDATFSNPAYRELLKRRAEKEGVRVLFFWLNAPDNVVKERMEKRKKERTASDADWEVYLQMKRRFVPPEDAVEVDATKEPEEIASFIRGYIDEVQKGAGGD